MSPGIRTHSSSHGFSTRNPAMFSKSSIFRFVSARGVVAGAGLVIGWGPDGHGRVDVTESAGGFIESDDG